MKKFLIFKKLENGFGDKLGSYESDFKDNTSANRSYLAAEPLASHFELPEGVDEECVTLEKIEGTFSLVEKEELVLAKRQSRAESNLKSIRMLRELLLKEADIEIFKLEDSGMDVSAMRTYRKSLRDCTNSLKKTNGEAELSCEDIIPSEFQFPIKP